MLVQVLFFIVVHGILHGTAGSFHLRIVRPQVATQTNFAVKLVAAVEEADVDHAGHILVRTVDQKNWFIE